MCFSNLASASVGCLGTLLAIGIYVGGALIFIALVVWALSFLF